MTTTALAAKNSDFYNAFWSKTYLTSPRRFNTWPLMAKLAGDAEHRLEIGPGLRPRSPISGTRFLDISPFVVARLNARGGLGHCGDITELPFTEHSMDLVAAFDVIEHVEDDRRVFAEIRRVLKPGGQLVFSVPLHADRWTTFDDYVGHARRYTPEALRLLLSSHGLVVEKSAVFGMQSNNPRLLEWAVNGLKRHHSIAVRCYNWLFFPLGLLFQKPLVFREGLMDLSEVDEVLLICRAQR
jgi:SAM-dependent methyltransferase